MLAKIFTPCYLELLFYWIEKLIKSPEEISKRGSGPLYGENEA